MRLQGNKYAIVFAALFFLPACSSEPTQAEACAAYAQSSCDAMQRCSPDAFNRVYGDTATCTARQQLGCGYQFPANSNTKPQNFIDCAAVVTSASCSQLLVNQNVVLTNLPECRPLPGTQELGSVCFSDTQCASTFCNKGLLGGLCGACAQRAAANGDCDATACEFGLICAQQGSLPNRCVTPASVGLGQSCDQTARCQSGLVCVNQRCATILKVGEACMPGQNSDACDRNQGLSCDSNTQRCVATQYVKPGQACGGNQRTTCTGSSKCINDMICLGPSGDGQSTFYPCLPPALAVNGVCVLPDPALCH